MTVRDNLSRVAARWRVLTEPQRVEWMEAASAVKSNSRLGQSGALSGFQLFAKINCTLAQFADLAPQDLVITNMAGVIAVKLVCPADPGDNTVLRASPPQSAGVGTCREFRIIGTCPVPVAGLADITALYTACFGPPPVGRRIFLRASTMVSGFESLPREFRARVPAS
jgi:hypothetical protein